MQISDSIIQQAKELTPLDGPLNFGTNIAPFMFTAEWFDNKWHEPQITPYQPIAVDPAAKVFHYAQTIFEGIKAFVTDANQMQIFRPQLNFERFLRSAKKMCMPTVPQDIFFQGLESITALCNKIIPTNRGDSLYLRPLMIGTQPALGLASSNRYLFVVIASPSGMIHHGSMRVKVIRDQCRSSIGGTGAVKAGANYAISLHTTTNIQAEDFDQPLWLDPYHRKYIEELSGMNLFFCYPNKIVTPELTDTFLAGITRQSIIELIKGSTFLNLEERPMAIDDVLQDISDKKCTEVFACGTATIISSISKLGDGEKTYNLPTATPLAPQLKELLLDIQQGDNHPYPEWVHAVEPII